MTEILFRDEKDGSNFVVASPKAQRALDNVQKWAQNNQFERITFWRDADDQNKYWVQLGDDRLNYWIHESTFSEGKHEDIEMQMDYARGAQRRSAAGYDKFDK